ncbi:MAG: hypothetical protein IKF42_13550 [Mogibacterium sp.]|nr:hypothetical protein [Mogibacterium sp.]
MTNTIDARAAIAEWFETDFKDAAKATTKTSRLEDGRLSYSFSVVNNSGFDFEKFSFKIKVIDRTNNMEIGTASINAGKWAGGEKKTFKSRLTIPAGVRNLSFVMYANSLDYTAIPADGVVPVVREVSGTLQDIGDAITGADGSGGVFGELFGTGGMPGSGGKTVTTKTTTTRNANGTTTTKTTTTTTTRKSESGTVNAAPRRQTSAGRQSGPSYQNGSFTQRRNEKRLNKKRLGKSGWTVASLVTGILFLMSAAGSTGDPEFGLGVAIVGGILIAAAGIMKLVLNTRAKRIRTYEAKINRNGNTSIDDLAAAVGKPFNKVADELQAMIADGFFPEAYVDINNRMLVMTKNGVPIESVERSAAEVKAAKRKRARDKGQVPESLDDLIVMTDDSELKSKLKALRTITKKIDARVEAVPELEKQVRDFREKYYPEVVRLTDDYNQKIADMGKLSTEIPKEEVTTDSTGAPVINTNPNYLQEQADEIKAQLISLIDSVTEASENLLEKLHEDDIMDITTDIKMLQTTLASKGLLDSDFDI